MNLQLSERHAWVLQSEIRNMSIECDRLGGINLSQGVCDTEVPPVVREGAREAMEQGINTYTRYDGLEELRRAIADKQRRFTGMEVDPEGEIVVSAGATGALYCTCLALLNPGDEVVVFEPFYGYHLSTLVATGAKPVYVSLEPPAWSFNMDSLEKVLTPRTRAMIVNTPANPSGKVFSAAELNIISEFALRNDLFVFTDEIYEHFLYDGCRHVPPALLPGMRERTITISGLSKTFSITGWRVGYALGDARWLQTIGHFNDLVYVCAPAPLQIGVARGLRELGPDYYTGLAGQYLRKRDMICAALAAAGMPPLIPQGAYYVLADVSRLPGADSKEKAMYILRETGVASVPGSAFYHDGGGENLVRFCFAKDDPILAEACKRLLSLK
ncbi:MAG TPA: aminotransferase class I/II-fold pyridoxal phosphate-dependent enzyme, partial [Syntrophales bacterium]|jgi:aminotransferase|nr:aminotransferase class I/II-fold pyridoxal phosphate-dependent enzyme [Syntrophales bacterium]HON24016.1 aminotransferase class I/II-fold pyridoxal phosphate-dependent enzyme [Syntrophales bacterium]HQG34820.1 aminotransferase class I/II-fold pyridoxal phosphate-dependent enzyme [Syntrophales bacterium]HRU89112.1 aminotransferase class I/II-fold pyridoxal phosphate-dependent enzyme [Syntrophales bacterium]